VLAFPSKPSQAQLQMGALLATNFQQKETEKGWCVAIRLILEKGGRQYGDRKPPDWNSRIVTVSINSEVRPTLSRSTVEPVTKIGTWVPEGH
jgi:hypothetical protein